MHNLIGEDDKKRIHVFIINYIKNIPLPISYESFSTVPVLHLQILDGDNKDTLRSTRKSKNILIILIGV